MVEKYSTEREWNFYRNFRDDVLLILDAGSKYYEMYHFISSLVSIIIIKMHDNKEEVLYKIYYDKIVPFKELLENNKLA